MKPHIRSLAAFIMVILPLCALAEEWQWAPHLEVGSTLPAFEATTIAGEKSGIRSFSGKKGMLLIFSRSTDW